MVEVINELVAEHDYSDIAYFLSEGLRDGSHRFLEEVDDRLTDWSDNRKELDRLIRDFLYASDRTNPLGSWTPGQLNVTEMELGDAIDGYLSNNPDVAVNDERLSRETILDGKKVFDLSIALLRLSDDAQALEPNQELNADFGAFLDQDPSRTAALTLNPLVLIDLQSQFESAFQSGALNPADFSWNPGRLEWLSGSQSEFSVARNLRFMIMELANPSHPRSPALLPPVVQSNPFAKLSGPALFVVAGTSALSDATGARGRALSTFDRPISPARGDHSSYLTSR